MKRRIASATFGMLMTMSFCASSQFRAEFGGIIGAQVHSPNAGYGLFFSPQYKIKNFAVGLRGEFLVKNSTSIVDLNFLSQWSVTGQYFLTQRAVSTFIGAGVGVYSATSTAGYVCDCSFDAQGSSLGFYPRIGLSYGHLVIAAEYNIINPIKAVASSDIPGQHYSSVHRVNIDYFNFKVGVLMGAGKRKK